MLQPMHDTPIPLRSGDLPLGELRRWQRSDHSRLLAIANNPAVTRNLSHRFPQPYTDADAHAWFDAVASEVLPLNLAIAVDGAVVGNIGLRVGEGDFARSAELGYWLAEPFWGRGLVTAAVCAFVPDAMARLGLVRVYAHAITGNRGSIRVLEKAGFVYEGTLRASAFKRGQVLDRVLYARVDPGLAG